MGDQYWRVFTLTNVWHGMGFFNHLFRLLFISLEYRRSSFEDGMGQVQ